MNNVPNALISQTSELPWVSIDCDTPSSEMSSLNKGNFQFQLIHVNLEAALWVVRARFAPGTSTQKHKHTAEVFAFTISGSWHYLEYPDDINVAGSYLYEPAGSVHTLNVPSDNKELTDVFFVMRGVTLNLGENGEVESVSDADETLKTYLELCRAQGVDVPRVLGL